MEQSKIPADGADGVFLQPRDLRLRNADLTGDHRVHGEHDLLAGDVPREQRILAMRFYDGKTQMEVSGEIGIRVSRT